MRRRAGFVLVAALWLIVALGAVGLDTALRTKARRQPALNQLDGLRAREAALAGTEYARSRLTATLLQRAAQLRAEGAGRQQSGARSGRAFSGRAISAALAAEDPWRDPAELVSPTMAVGDAEFHLDVHDTGVAVNINQATEAMLRGLLADGLRVDYALAGRITQAILDWRDTDDLPRVNGGEREEYIDARAPVLPSNRPFASPDEVRHVLGMTPELFAALRPYITVTGSGRINVSSAPEPVLFAVPTFTRPVVTQVLRRRAGGQYARAAQELRALLGGVWRPSARELQDVTRRATFSTNEVEIVARGLVSGGVVTATVRTIVVRADEGAVVLWRSLE